MRLTLTQPSPLDSQRIPIKSGGWPLLSPLVVPHTLDTVESVALLTGAGQGVPPIRGQSVNTVMTRGDQSPASEAVPQQPLLLLGGQRPGPVSRVSPAPRAALLLLAALIDVVN